MLMAEDHEPKIGMVCEPLIGSGCTSPKSEIALELHSRAAPSVEAHHCVNDPEPGRNSGGRRIMIIKT